MKLLALFLIIFLVAISLASAAYIPLPYKQTLSKASLKEIVNVNFEVKDSDGNSMENALIIIQGISDQTFNKNLLSDI